jgi:hypothetical protein
LSVIGHPNWNFRVGISPWRGLPTTKPVRRPGPPLIEIRHSAGKRGWLKTSFLGHLSDHKRQEYQNLLFSETK